MCIDDVYAPNLYIHITLSICICSPSTTYRFSYNYDHYAKLSQMTVVGFVHETLYLAMTFNFTLYLGMYFEMSSFPLLSWV